MKNKNTAGVKAPRVKVKRRFNFIDLLILLAIVLLGAIVVNLFFPQSVFKSNNTKKEIQYTVEFLGVDGELIDKIKENDVVVDSVSKTSVGSVILVDRNTLHSELKYDETNKEGKLAVYENKYNVLVTISVMADYTAGEGYSVGGRRIAVGEKLSLILSDYAGEGYCINLSAAQ